MIIDETYYYELIEVNHNVVISSCFSDLFGLLMAEIFKFGGYLPKRWSS